MGTTWILSSAARPTNTCSPQVWHNLKGNKQAFQRHTIYFQEAVLQLRKKLPNTNVLTFRMCIYSFPTHPLCSLLFLRLLLNGCPWKLRIRLFRPDKAKTWQRQTHLARTFLRSLSDCEKFRTEQKSHKLLCIKLWLTFYQTDQTDFCWSCSFSLFFLEERHGRWSEKLHNLGLGGGVGWVKNYHLSFNKRQRGSAALNLLLIGVWTRQFCLAKRAKLQFKSDYLWGNYYFITQ